MIMPNVSIKDPKLKSRIASKLGQANKDINEETMKQFSSYWDERVGFQPTP